MRLTVPPRALAAVLFVLILSPAVTALAQARLAPVPGDPITAHTLVSVDYSVRGPRGGESLSVGPDGTVRFQTEGRFRRPGQSSLPARMSPAQFRQMIGLVNAADLAHLPARVGRRIMDGPVVTVSVTARARRHQLQTITITGEDSTRGGLSQLQMFLDGFLNAH